MTIEMVNGVLTKVAKSRNAPKSAVEPAPAKSKSRKAKAVEPALSAEPVATPGPETPAPVAEQPTKRGKLALVKDTLAAKPETPAPAAPPKAKRKPKSFDAELDAVAAHAESLAGLSKAYEGVMRGAGKTPGTIASYRAELALAMKHLGEATPIADLTVDQVRAYFESAPVTRLRSGRAKSPLSIDKTRRVLRLALLWAEAQGWVAKAPVPDMPSAS
jgi:pyruvate dehydrogenase E2 component (dihydrolipoamide acetyltransferase)